MQISIIIPAYNVGKNVYNTLESICRNNISDTEIIVIDDGSTDNTWEQINKCLDQYKPPFCKKIRQENKGVSVARNVGITTSTGRYLVFCDGDDICKSNLIETILQYTDEDWDMLVWRYDITQGNRVDISQPEFSYTVLKGQDIFKSFLFGENRIRLGSFAVKRELIEKHSIQYTEGCVLSQDVEFIFKCLAHTNTLRAVDNILFTYAKREGSVMYKYNIKRFEAPRMVRRLGDYIGKNTDLYSDSMIENYLQNGFFIQHTMFAFDSCITYLHFNTIRHFWNQYLKEYKDVEMQIRNAKREMIFYPKVQTKMKAKLFCTNRILYILFSMMKQRVKG